MKPVRLPPAMPLATSNPPLGCDQETWLPRFRQDRARDNEFARDRFAVTIALRGIAR
jgi:hypothetical protein